MGLNLKKFIENVAAPKKQFRVLDQARDILKAILCPNHMKYGIMVGVQDL